MLRAADGATRVEGFLSWLRGVFQGLGGDSPVLIVSGSIGLMPIVQRLGIPDRINYLDPFRLGPWSREASVACFDQLATSVGLSIEDGVAGAAYEALGIGIPHHVQSFFARLREHAIMESRGRVRLADIEKVYRTGMLGPSGQSDLAHYETRLRDALDDGSRSLAMEVLAEAATQDVFTAAASARLSELYSRVVEDPRGRITEVLDVLLHDGYLEKEDRGYRFPFRLLKGNCSGWRAGFEAGWDHRAAFEDRNQSIDHAQAVLADRGDIGSGPAERLGAVPAAERA